VTKQSRADWRHICHTACWAPFVHTAPYERGRQWLSCCLNVSARHGTYNSSRFSTQRHNRSIRPPVRLTSSTSKRRCFALQERTVGCVLALRDWMQASDSAVCQRGQTHSQVAISGTKSITHNGSRPAQQRNVFRHLSVPFAVETIIHNWQGLVEQTAQNIASKLPSSISLHSNHHLHPKYTGNWNVQNSNYFPQIPPVVGRTVTTTLDSLFPLGSYTNATVEFRKSFKSNQAKKTEDDRHKGFWRWYTTFQITGFLDFAHCPVFRKWVSKIGSVSIFRWGEEDTYSVWSLRNS
jgi:hypothetical protein